MASPSKVSLFSEMDDIYSVDDDPESRPDLGMSGASIKRANSVKRMRDRAMTLVQKYGGTWSAEALRTEWVIRTIMSINRQYWRNLETRALESERVTKEIEREKARIRRPVAELRREVENLKAALKDANAAKHHAMERTMALEAQADGLRRQAEAAETAAAVATAECVTIQELLDDRYCEQTEIRKNAMVKQHDLKEQLRASRAHMRQRRQDLKSNEILLREAKDGAKSEQAKNAKLKRNLERLNAAYHNDRAGILEQMGLLLDHGLTGTDVAGARGGPKEGVAAFAGRRINGVKFFINNKRRVGLSVETPSDGVEDITGAKGRPRSAPPASRRKVGSAPVDAWAYAAEKRARERPPAGSIDRGMHSILNCAPPGGLDVPAPPEGAAGAGGPGVAWGAAEEYAGSVSHMSARAGSVDSFSTLGGRSSRVSSSRTGAPLSGGRREALEARKAKQRAARERAAAAAELEAKELAREARARAVLFGSSPFN